MEERTLQKQMFSLQRKQQMNKQVLFKILML